MFLPHDAIYFVNRTNPSRRKTIIYNAATPHYNIQIIDAKSFNFSFTQSKDTL